MARRSKEAPATEPFLRSRLSRRLKELALQTGPDFRGKRFGKIIKAAVLATSHKVVVP
jgi:hypothetical protein